MSSNRFCNYVAFILCLLPALTPTLGSEEEEEQYIPPTISLNTEVVVECDPLDSGVYLQYEDKTSRTGSDGSDEFCYHYVLSRYEKAWFCDYDVPQTWSYLILDPCPDTPNSDSNTFLLQLQEKLSKEASGSLGAYFDSDWYSAGYLFENSEVGSNEYRIEFELCLKQDLNVIENGQYCFYSYYNESKTPEPPQLLANGRYVYKKGRRASFDILREDNRRRRRTARRRMIVKDENGRKRMLEETQDDSGEFTSSEGEQMFWSQSVAAAGAGAEQGEDGSESNGNGNGVTYYICATRNVAVPDVCGQA